MPFYDDFTGASLNKSICCFVYACVMYLQSFMLNNNTRAQFPCIKSRPATRDVSPLEYFSPPLEKCVGLSLKLLDIV